VEKGNIYYKIPADISHEVFEVLVQSKQAKIECILSKEQTSPDTGWYDRKQNE